MSGSAVAGASSPSFDTTGFPGRLEQVRERIERASGDPRSVVLVAVTKGFGPDAVAAALAAGLDQLGENYADELVDKAAAVDPADPTLPTWHFLGAVQRNKVARLSGIVTWWQGVSRLEEGRAIARRSAAARVLVQVDVTGRAGRGGCPPDRVAELVLALVDEGVDVAGLMAVGRPGPPEDARRDFALVSSLADSLDLGVRSMGMSDDLEVALSEGSTMVRLGRALFGPRPPRP
jgi:uncharacterized pyridoxal phosphate-containing UPF0001 family protein